MLVRDYIIALFMFAMLFTGFAMFYSDTIKTYGITGNTNYGKTYNQTDEIYEYSQEIYGKVNQTGGTEDTGQDALFLGAWSAFKLTFKSFGYIIPLINSIFTDLGIPKFILITFLGIITITLVFMIISAILKGLV